jgi:hypothetical protein
MVGMGKYGWCALCGCGCGSATGRECGGGKAGEEDGTGKLTKLMESWIFQTQWIRHE